MVIFLLTLAFFCATVVVNLVIGSYDWVAAVFLAAVTGVWFMVALVLFWRRSTDPFVLLVSLELVVLGGVGTQPFQGSLMLWSSAWEIALAWTFLAFLNQAGLIIVYLFPDGRFVPRFTRWLALGWAAISLATDLPITLDGAWYPWNWWSSLLFTGVRTAFYCTLALALFYRYRWVSTPVQRQQIKWVVFAFALVVVGVSGLDLYFSTYPAIGLSAQLFQLATWMGWCVPVLFPISIGVALLRSHLWDVDLLIRRTLIYSLVTGVLATVFAISSIVLQAGFGAVTQQRSALAVVGSTLAIAALFQPVRSRVQAAVDRRFYRRKYDATRTLALFGATLQAEMDVAELSTRLLAVIEETMQPAHVSLWLRPTQQRGEQQEAVRSAVGGSAESAGLAPQ